MTTLGEPVVGDSYGNTVAGHVRDQARIARELHGGRQASIGRKANIATLEALADFIASLPQSNQLLRALQVIEIARGTSRDRFNPGPKANRYLAQVGLQEVAALDAEPTFEGLVAACAVDLAAQVGESAAAAKREAEGREAAEQANSRLAKSLSDSEAGMDQWRNRAIEHEAEVRRLTSQLDHAVSMIESPETGDDASRVSVKIERGAKVSEGSRRQRHPDVENLYTRKDSKGATVYELGWREDGKQRWRTIGPDLPEALDARAQLVKAGLIREPAATGG